MKIGHKALSMECGLIHRDVSGSNVLLATSGKSKGFLHDLDYSAYVREWNTFASQSRDDLFAHRELKEITVSRYAGIGTSQPCLMQPFRELINSWPEMFWKATRTFRSMISNHFFGCFLGSAFVMLIMAGL